MARKRSKADKPTPEKASRPKKKVAPPGSLPEMAPVPATDPTAHEPPATTLDAGFGADGFIEVVLSDERGPTASGRRQARIPIAARVDVSSLYGVARAQAVADVSLGGVFVETTELLEVGDPVILGFPDTGGKLRVSGRVRWVTPFGGVRDARPGMGIELIGVTESDRMRIFELLRGKR